MANVFTTDPNCVALYRFESGALETDTIGTNTLTNNDSDVVANVADYQEGAACADFEKDTYARMLAAETDMDSDVPGTVAGDPHYFLSVACWFKAESSLIGLGAENNPPLAGFWNHLNYHYRSWLLGVGSSGARLVWQYASASYANVTATRTISLNTWYHVAATLDCINGRAAIRLYDSGTGVTYTDLSTSNIPAKIRTDSETTFWSGGFIGFAEADGVYFDGLIDELVIFKDALTANEIDAIRQGHYGNWIFLGARLAGAGSLAAELSGPIGICTELGRFHPETRYRERLIWRTDIPKGADGSEQRIATRRPPRQQIEMPFVLPTPNAHTRAAALVHRWAKHNWGLPIWHDHVTISSALSAGATTVPVDTTASDFRDDSFAMLWQPGQYEVVDIATTSASQLNLSAPLINDYSGQTKVMPLRRARLYGRAKVQRFRGGAGRLTLPLEAIDNEEVSGYTAAQSYDGMAVLTTPAYLPNQLYESVADPDLIIVDGLTGAVDDTPVSDYNIVAQPHILIAETPAEAWSLRQWLYAIRGRQKKFLVPTFAEDLTLTQQIGAADVTVNVAHAGLAATMDGNTIREYIAVRDGGRGSAITVRRVTAIAQVDSDTEQLTIDAAVGAIIPATALCCWVDQCHLASDVVEIDWIRPGVCVCSIRIIRVT